MSFGDILRNLLEERDISQKQLGVDLNIAASTLGNYIRNIREPDFETLKLFAFYFNVSTDYLLGFQPNKNDLASHSESELIRIFRSLTKEQQDLYIEQGKLYIKLNNKK
mgnify:CR=1 FL=1